MKAFDPHGRTDEAACGAARAETGRTRSAATAFAALVFAVASVAMSAPAPAQDTPAANARDEDWERRAKLEFDDATGTWREVEPPAPGTAEGDLYAARMLIKDEEYDDAVDALKKWEKTYGELDPNFAAMLIAKAQAQIGDREYYKAHQTLQRFLNEFEGTELTDEALRQEFVIAEVFLGGTRRKIWGMRILKADDIGVRILDDISAHYAGEQIAEYALKTKGDFFRRTGEHDLAEMEYSRLAQEYPNSRYYPNALLLAARSAIATYRGTAYDESPLIEAAERYEEYANRFPDDPENAGVTRELETIRQERAMKDFTVGRYYERTRHPRSAIFYYKKAVERWPGTTAQALAAARLEILQD